MNENSNSYYFDSSNLLTYINKKKKPLLIITMAAVVVSTIVSFLIEPRYKSEVILYPTSPASISNCLLSDKITEKNILNFGEEEELEQLLQVLQSYEIRDRIIEKYNLMEHYKIDPSSRYPRTRLHNKFEDNISFKRTEFMSAKIEVLDTDPRIAAKIADNIAALLDTAMNRMQKTRAVKALEIVEKEYFGFINRVIILEDSLKIIRSKGVIDYESQAEVYNEAYAKAVYEGKKNAAKEFEKKLNILAEYGGAYVSLRELLLAETKKLSVLESKYMEAKVDAEQDLPHKFIVNRAEVAEKKTYPIRWLTVLISSLATFIFSLFVLIIFDNIKKKNDFLM